MNSIYAFDLSVFLFVCAHSNSCKYSSNVLKLIYVIHIWHTMDHIEKGYTCDYWFVYRDSQKFSDIFRLMEEKCLKRILKYLYWTKYSKINMCHPGIPKHVSYKKWYKTYKYFIYRLTQKFSHSLRPTEEAF